MSEMAGFGAVLVPVPRYGFDPVEFPIPWKTLKEAGVQVVFATPDGQPAAADRVTLTGEGLPAPLRNALMADSGAIAAYKEMERAPEFQNPISYEQIRTQDFDGLILPGGQCAAETWKGVLHERLKPCLKAAQMMRAGPSGSVFRSGSQTTPSCCVQKAWW